MGHFQYNCTFFHEVLNYRDALAGTYLYTSSLACRNCKTGIPRDVMIRHSNEHDHPLSVSAVLPFLFGLFGGLFYFNNPDGTATKHMCDIPHLP